jgi:hypothetical protein
LITIPDPVLLNVHGVAESGSPISGLRKGKTKNAPGGTTPVQNGILGMMFGSDSGADELCGKFHLKEPEIGEAFLIF